MLDHPGDTVHAEIEVVHGDASNAVVTADGVLRRWRDDPSAAAVRDSQRHDIEGLFAIGRGHLVCASVGARAPEPDETS